jgi:ribonuclease P protein component
MPCKTPGSLIRLIRFCSAVHKRHCEKELRSLYRFNGVIHRTRLVKTRVHILTAGRCTRLISPFCPRAFKPAHPTGHQHEKNLSTQQDSPEAHPRLSCTYGNQTRTPGIERPPCKGPGETLPLSLTRNGFPPAARLRMPAEFTRAFRTGARIMDSCFHVYVSPGQDVARLGINVARKAVSNATARNRIKRQIRESFRNHRNGLPAVDIVVQARQPAATADNVLIRNSLEWHWQELIKQCAAS